MAARKARKKGRRRSSTGQESGRSRRPRGGGRDQLFDPAAIFPFDGSGDGLEHIRCSDGFAGEFAQAINNQCCGVWSWLATLPDSKLGRAMVKVLDTTGNGMCLSEAEKQLIRDWPPHQLRYAVESVVAACKKHDSIDPHLTKFKTLPNLPPAVWVWTRPYGTGACGVYLVFLHPDFDLEFPGDCGTHQKSVANLGRRPSADRRRRRSA